jgi:hypothetical protein
MRKVEGGIYVLQYSNKTIKLGMGIDIEKRLRQYRGYHAFGQDYKRMLIIKSKYPRELETLLHKTLTRKYERIGKLEIFKVERNEQNKAIKMII